MQKLGSLLRANYTTLSERQGQVTTVASTKGQLVKLIRSLIAFGNTLGELPRERFLNIKVLRIYLRKTFPCLHAPCQTQERPD